MDQAYFSYTPPYSTMLLLYYCTIYPTSYIRAEF